MKTLILGCGYVGLPLGRALAGAGHEVFGVCRALDEETRQKLQAASIAPWEADITKPEDLGRLPGPFDWVVNCVSSSRGGGDVYRDVYYQGTANLIEWLSATSVKKYVFTGSTSVYGQTDGSLVKESSPTEPASETSKILVETERLLAEAFRAKKFPAVLLRVAGIYGPERGHLFQQYLRNEARIPGKGERFINMIHLQDAVDAISTALKHGKPGEIYNVVDDEPVAHIHFFRWLSETLGKWMPPFATEEENAARKRGLTHKKVSNRKMKMELGVILKYPTFRQGYTAEIQRLEDAGLLDIKPEPR